MTTTTRVPPRLDGWAMVIIYVFEYIFVEDTTFAQIKPEIHTRDNSIIFIILNKILFPLASV